MTKKRAGGIASDKLNLERYKGSFEKNDQRFGEEGSMRS